jgi:hypothetical protein
VTDRAKLHESQIRERPAPPAKTKAAEPVYFIADEPGVTFELPQAPADAPLPEITAAQIEVVKAYMRRVGLPKAAFDDEEE